MQRLARSSYRHRRIVLGVWVVLLVGLMALASTAGGVFKVDFSLPGSESERAFDILEARGFGDRTGEQGQIVFSAPQGVDDPQVEEAMEQFFAEVENGVEGVTVVSPYTEAGARQVAEDGTIAYAEVNFTDRPSSDYPTAATEILDLKDEIDVEAVKVEIGGDIFAAEAFGSSEGIGLLLAVIILLVAFGSVLAAGLPIATAAVRHRLWHRDRPARRERDEHARLHRPGRVDDRYRRGHRLRALHRHALPRSAGLGTRA